MRLVAVLCENHLTDFDEASLTKHFELLKAANMLVTVPKRLFRKHYHARNRYFPENFSHIVCIECGIQEDTYRLVSDAKAQSTPVTNLHEIICDQSNR